MEWNKGDSFSQRLGDVSWNTRVEPQPQYFASPSLVPATLRLVSHLSWDLHWGFPRGKFQSRIFGETLKNIIEANDLSKYFSELTFGLVSWTFLGNIPKPLRCIIGLHTYWCSHTHTDIYTVTYIQIPVGPRKVVAEVSRIGHYRRGELLWCMDGRANPLMDRKVVGVVLFGVVAMVAVVTSLTTPGCSVV